MNERTILELMCGAAGVLFIGLGIPLMKGRVSPNSWYGFRTKRTLSDEKVWYAVNRAAGLDMVIAGILILACALVVFLLGGELRLEYVAAILASVTLLSIAGMVVHGLSIIKRMGRGHM